MGLGIKTGLGIGVLGVAVTGVGFGIRLGSKFMDDEANDKIEDLKKAHGTISKAADKAIAELKEHRDILQENISLMKKMQEQNERLEMQTNKLSKENMELVKETEEYIELSKGLSRRLMEYETKEAVRDEDISKEKVDIYKLQNKVDDLKIKLFDLRNRALFNESIDIRDEAIKDICSMFVGLTLDMASMGVEMELAAELTDEFTDAIDGMQELIDEEKNKDIVKSDNSVKKQRKTKRVKKVVKTDEV